MNTCPRIVHPSDKFAAFSAGDLNLSDAKGFCEIQFQEASAHFAIFNTVPGVVISIVNFIWSVLRGPTLLPVERL